LADSTVRVKGLVELNRAINRADKDTKKLLKAPFKRVGEIVRAEGESRFSGVDTRSATGFRVVVRTRGVSVDQRRKNSGGSKRPNYTRMQQDTLEAALDSKESEVVDEMNKALEEIADIIRRA
jgi:hypothetical protein